jgi:hypothetical protein
MGSKKKRRQFLLTFFDNTLEYQEKEVNGYFLVKRLSNNKWDVAVYSKQKFRTYKQFTSRPMKPVNPLRKIEPIAAQERTDIDPTHIKLLKQAWDNRERDEQDKYVPRHNGIAMSINLRDWRASHPQDFPEYCEYLRINPSLAHNFNNRTYSLPTSIIKLFSEGQVTVNEFHYFITRLIQFIDAENSDKPRVLAEDIVSSLLIS